MIEHPNAMQSRCRKLFYGIEKFSSTSDVAMSRRKPTENLSWWFAIRLHTARNLASKQRVIAQRGDNRRQCRFYAVYPKVQHLFSVFAFIFRLSTAPRLHQIQVLQLPSLCDHKIELVTRSSSDNDRNPAQHHSDYLFPRSSGSSDQRSDWYDAH
jgi:hypothetical protein